MAATSNKVAGASRGTGTLTFKQEGKDARELQFTLDGNAVRSLKLISGYGSSDDDASVSLVAGDVGRAVLEQWPHAIRKEQRNPGPNTEALRALSGFFLEFEDPLFKLSATPLDYALHSKSVFLWDTGIFFGVASYDCPTCKCPMQRNGFCPTVRHLRGLGGRDKDVFLVTKRWTCNNKAGTLKQHQQEQQSNISLHKEAMATLLQGRSCMHACHTRRARTAQQ
jgi:hypothetical protein